MQVFLYFVLALIGLAVGSFIAALTYRLPKGIDIKKGRSFCPKCKGQIAWYDNIPLFSYLFLHGRCRNCKKKISHRYFLIELSTATVFLAIFAYMQGNTLTGNFWPLPYLLVIASILIIIFIIDLENQLIFDEFVYFAFGLVFTLTLLFKPESLYENMLAGFSAGSFLLFLHLITRGRGMGLGDVKLALFAGLFLGGIYTVVWLFMGFILGAVIGLMLLALGKAKVGRPIPFGPFLVVSLFITFLFGDTLVKLFFPFL